MEDEFSRIGSIQEIVTDLIKQVNRGDVKAVVVVTLLDTEGKDMTYHWSDGKCKLELVGALELVQQELLRCMESVPPDDGEEVR